MNRTGPQNLAQQLKEWQLGIAHETAFWSGWIEAQGAQWGWEFERRLDPDATVDAAMASVIDRIGDKRISILDVGSGPVTSVGRRYVDFQIEISACDPLADSYREMLDLHGIRPPVATEFALAEDLNLKYDTGQFSVVYCRNALDHSLDPIRGIVQMLTVCRIGGCVLLQHVPNEAENERYEGFHRWNFTNAGEELVTWNRESSINASRVVSPFADGENMSVEGYVTNLFWKKREIPERFYTDDRDRYLTFQRAFVDICSISALSSPSPELPEIS